MLAVWVDHQHDEHCIYCVIIVMLMFLLLSWCKLRITGVNITPNVWVTVTWSDNLEWESPQTKECSLWQMFHSKFWVNYTHLFLQCSFRKVDQTLFAVPKYRLCMGSMIVILTGSKYGNCNRQEYLQPNSDSLRSRAVLVEHSKIDSISFRCRSTDRGTHLSQSNPEKSCLPKTPVPKLL